MDERKCQGIWVKFASDSLDENVENPCENDGRLCRFLLAEAVLPAEREATLLSEKNGLKQHIW